MTTATISHVRVVDGSDDSVRKIHALFQQTLETLNVEDMDSFRVTISPITNADVTPKLVGAYEDDGLIGAMLGFYLWKLNAGMVLYAGVREPFRGRGVYMKMRAALLAELAAQSTIGLDFLLSEIEEGDRLLQKYLHKWGAFVAPCDYVQPAVQGLPRRKLDLVVVPVATNRAEITENLPSIIHEVFRGVYRIAEPERHPDFRHVVESIRT